MDMLEKTDTERYDQYFQNNDYLVWEMANRNYYLVRIVDMNPGLPEFKVVLQENKNEDYYLSKMKQLEFARFKVIEMFQ